MMTLSVTILGILGVVYSKCLKFWYSECRYAKCHHAECCGAFQSRFFSLSQKTIDLTILKQMKTKRTKSGLARSQKQKKKRKK
jgi:hypothetical protein